LPPAWRAEISRWRARLAGREAGGRGLDAVVERVADEVDDRIAERLHDAAVELGVLAREHELDVLAELRGEVAHEPREAQEDASTGIIRTCITIACSACELRSDP